MTMFKGKLLYQIKMPIRHSKKLLVFSILLALLLLVLHLRILYEGPSIVFVFPERNLTNTIPRILHQTWDTENIPRTFAPWMMTWRKLQPDWEFWFWTEADVLHLLHQYYPDFVNIYLNFSDHLMQADASRYFILYHYGGVYADLDVEALKPLDPLLDSSSCILTREPYEHAQMLYGQSTPYIMNTIMACRPRHPMFKLLYQTLRERVKMKSRNAVRVTGPIYLTRIQLQYQNHSISKSVENSVNVLEPRYLLPTCENYLYRQINQLCSSFFGLETEINMPKWLNCDERKNWKNRPTNVSYTNHHWFHVVMKTDKWKHRNTFSVRSLRYMKLFH